MAAFERYLDHRDRLLSNIDQWSSGSWSKGSQWNWPGNLKFRAEQMATHFGGILFAPKFRITIDDDDKQ
jgi:hypothetical protein